MRSRSKSRERPPIRAQDTPTWLRRLYTDYDFDLTSNTPSALPDPTLGIQRVYWSKNIIKGAPFSNGAGYSNPEMDKVLEEQGLLTARGKTIVVFGARPKVKSRAMPEMKAAAAAAK